MAAKRHSPLQQWEQEMIDAFYDYQWRLVLDPLYEKFQGWKAGNISHDEIDRAIHKTHKECQDVYNLFTSKHDFLVRMIQFNEDWYPQWEKDHPHPSKNQQNTE